MRNPITTAKQKIDENKTYLAFVAGVASTVGAAVVLTKVLPVKPFHHEFFPDQTTAEITAMLEKTKAIEMVCPHGVVSLFASDYV
jgi:hypothetical protein